MKHTPYRIIDINGKLAKRKAEISPIRSLLNNLLISK